MSLIRIESLNLSQLVHLIVRMTLDLSRSVLAFPTDILDMIWMGWNDYIKKATMDLSSRMKIDSYLRSMEKYISANLVTRRTYAFVKVPSMSGRDAIGATERYFYKKRKSMSTAPPCGAKCETMLGLENAEKWKRRFRALSFLSRMNLVSR